MKNHSDKVFINTEPSKSHMTYICSWVNCLISTKMVDLFIIQSSSHNKNRLSSRWRNRPHTRNKMQTSHEIMAIRHVCTRIFSLTYCLGFLCIGQNMMDFLKYVSSWLKIHFISCWCETESDHVRPRYLFQCGSSPTNISSQWNISFKLVNYIKNE